MSIRKPQSSIRKKLPVTLRLNQLVQVLDRLTSRRSDEQQQKDYQLEGEIRARRENILPDYDFIVDRWPDFKAMVGIVNKTKTKCPAFLRPQVLEDTTALVTLLLQPGLVDWSSEIEFINVYEAEKEALEAVIPSHQFRADPYLIMRVDSQTIK